MVNAEIGLIRLDSRKKKLTAMKRVNEKVDDVIFKNIKLIPIVIF